MRRSDLFAVTIFGCLSLALLGGLWGEFQQHRHQAIRERNRQLARSLSLTDLALFTEARYTRHLSQADNHAAFQDHPLALEHFPSGSLIFPPRPFRGRQ